MSRTLLLTLLLNSLISTLTLCAQETDCGNGIDDDGDALIDCADPDCQLQTLPLIPATGANAFQNGVLTTGSTDLNWEISTLGQSGVYIPATVMQPPGAYITSSWTNAQWVSHVQDGSHVSRGDIIDYYRLAFSLPCTEASGYDITSGLVCIVLTAYVDNSVHEIYVNGIPQSANIPSIPDMVNPYYANNYASGMGYTLQLCDNWIPGNNILTIGIASAPSAIGLLAHLSTTTLSILASSQISLTIQDVTGRGIELSYEIFSDIEMRDVFIERRGGIEPWKKITALRQDVEFSNGKYTYLDTPPQSGNWSYRVNGTDKNGQLTLSNIVEGSFESNAVVSLSPNPAPGAFTLRSPQAAIQSLALYDLTGRRLPAEISHERHEAQVRSGYRGLAIVQVKTDQGMWVQKVRME